MQGVLARFRDYVHLWSKRMPGFRGVAAIGVINFLDAIHAGSRDARRFLPFCVQKPIDVAAHRALAIEGDIQAGENILHPVDAALEESRRAYRSRERFPEIRLYHVR